MNKSNESDVSSPRGSFSSTLDSVEFTNPNLSDVTEENLEKIKGDAIGDTLYSERGVLKILIKLNQVFTEEWNDTLESELCLLWDMTLDKDVVNFIMKQNFINLSTEIIKFTDNIRLTEILVGIQGNMCCVEEVRVNFPASSLDVLLSLFETKTDALTLIQVVRLMHSVSWDLQSRNAEGHWLDNETTISRLSSHLNFILASSTNDELLMSSLELVDTLCRIHACDKDYSFYFANSETLRGMVECWKQVMGDWSPEDDFPSKTHRKMAEHWAAILSSFTSHHPGRLALSESGESVGEMVSKLIGRRFECDDCILLPCVSILEAIVRVYFNERTLIKLLNILHTITCQGNLNENDSELIDSIENYCFNVAVCVSHARLQNALTHCNENHVLLFWKAANERSNDITDIGERSI